MAENLKKLPYEPGDRASTSSDVYKCPNGHPVSVRANRRTGTGRVYCPTCNWNDGSGIMGTTPISTKSGGVTIISHRGVEDRRKPNVIGRHS